MRRQRRRARLALLGLGMAVLAPACARFTPAIPTGARSGDVELRLRELRVSASRDLVFESRSAVPHVVRRGWVTVATRDPCTGGADVASIAIDRGAVADGVLPAGSHELTVRFDDQLSDMSLDVVVDLEVDDGACLRVPAISQSVPLDAEKRLVVVSGFGLAGNPDVSGYRGTIDFHGGAGGWVGPALLTGQVGVGISLCNEGTCGREKDGSLRSGFTVPVAVDARFVFGTATVNRLFSVGLVGARYSFVPVRLPVSDGSERRFVAHAFQGVLAWGFNEKSVKGPFRHLERSIPFEIAVPLGVLVDQGAPHHGVVFAGGVELRLFFHL
jgi:hypothetical protein